MNKFSRKKEEAYLLDLIRQEINVDIYGIAGIGKTYVIDKLASRLSEEKTDKEIKYVKLKNTTDFIGLLEDIALILGENHESPFFEFRRILDKNNEFSEDTIVNLFSTCLSSIDKTLFILINTHLVKDGVWRELEENVLRFEYNEKKANFRIITVGQKKRQWSFFRLRDQTVSFKLELLTKEDTCDMVKNLSGRYKFKIENEKLAFETIFRLTKGHPESICIAVKHWTNKHTQPLNGNQIQEGERYSEGISALIDEFIQVKILPPLLEKFREGEHYPSGTTLLSFLQHLAPLRLFQVPLLRTALPILLPDFYQGKRAFFFDELFINFYGSILLEENEEGKGKFEILSIVRHILIEDLQFNNPDEFIEINNKISVAYDKLIEHDIVRRTEYLVEKIYLALLPATDDQKKVNAVRCMVVEHIQQYGYTDTKQLQNMLQNDSDLSAKMNWKALFKSL
jgi:hypothetical protein